MADDAIFHLAVTTISRSQGRSAVAAAAYRAATTKKGRPMLESGIRPENWSDGGSLDTMLRAGVTEIIGTTGSGRTEVCRVMFAAALRSERRCFAVVSQDAVWNFRADALDLGFGSDRVMVEPIPPLERSPANAKTAAVDGVAAALRAAKQGDLIIVDDYMGEFIDGATLSDCEDKGIFVLLSCSHPTPLVKDHDVILLRVVKADGLNLAARLKPMPEKAPTDLRAGEAYLLSVGKEPVEVTIKIRRLSDRLSVDW